MKLILFLLVFCFSSLGFGQSFNSNDVFLGINASTNYVKNPWAKDNGLYGSTSNATLARGTTDKLFGLASWSCDASAQNGYCEFALKPVLNPDANGNCEFKGVIYGDSALYRAQILDGSAVLKNQTAALTFNSTTAWNEFSVNYPCQATPKVRLTQTEAGTAPAVSVGVYYGKATNIGSGTAPNEFSAKVSTAGVLSDIVNPEYFNGTTFAPTDTSLFSIAFKNLTSVPNCNINPIDGSLTENSFAKIATLTSSGMTVRTGWSNTGSTFTKLAYAFSVSCTKTGADFVQPTITAPNWNFNDKDFTGTATATTGTLGTHVFDAMKYSRIGGKMWLRYKFRFTGTGTWTGPIFPYPVGITAPSSIANYRLKGVSLVDTGTNQHEGTVRILTNGIQIAGNYGTNGAAQDVTQAAPFTWASGDVIDVIVGPIDAIENGVPWTETMNVPQLTGSVTSDAPTAMNFFSAYSNTCSSHPCAMVWNAGVSAIGYNGTGDYTIYVPAGKCSAALSCSIQSNATGITQLFGANSTTYRFNTKDSAGSAGNAAFNFNCSCPR